MKRTSEDRQYLQAIELARLRTMEKQQDRRRPVPDRADPEKRTGTEPSSMIMEDIPVFCFHVLGCQNDAWDSYIVS